MRIAMLTVCAIATAYAAEDDGAYVIKKPQRTIDEIDRIYADMTAVRYVPPSDRWTFLPRTRKRLLEGGALRIVMLGDSIVNDTSRSSWTRSAR